MAILNRATDDMRKIGPELGIGPAARSRIDLVPEDPDDDSDLDEPR